MLFCVKVPPPTVPLPFSPFEPLLAVPRRPGWGVGGTGEPWSGGDGLGTDSPGGTICAGVGPLELKN